MYYEIEMKETKKEGKKKENNLEDQTWNVKNLQMLARNNEEIFMSLRKTEINGFLPTSKLSGIKEEGETGWMKAAGFNYLMVS